MSLPEDWAPSLRAYAIVLIALSCLVVGLRFWSRVIVPTPRASKFWWDDWMVLVALIVFIAECGAYFYTISLGAGQHYYTIPIENLQIILKVTWAVNWLANTSITASKASALFFYARLFTTVQPGFRSALWVGHALIWAWWIATQICNFFFCSPTQLYWDHNVYGFCRSLNAFYLGSSATSSAIDLYILLLPMPLLWSLKLKTTRKALISLLLALSYLIPAISLARTIYVAVAGDYLDADPTYNDATLAFLMLAEQTLSIVSVSLPAIFHLVRRVMKYGTRALTTSSVGRYTGDTINGPAGHRARSEASLTLTKAEIEEGQKGASFPPGNNYYRAMISRQTPDTDMMLDTASLMNQIRVHRAIDVSSEREYDGEG